MKQKILSLFLLTIILAIAVVNAATFSFTTTAPNALTKSNQYTSLIITNRGPDTINLQVSLPPTIDDGNGHSILISTTSALTFNNVAPNTNTETINITYSGDTTNFKIGDFSNNIIVTGSTNSTNTLTQSIPLKFTNTFCSSGDNGDALSISSIDIVNAGTGSGDDTTWVPLDKITIKVKVENAVTSNVRDVQVELGLIDPAGKDVIKSMDDLNNKKISLGTINEDKDKTAEFTFTIPTDFEEKDYLLVAKAYVKSKEADNCTSYSSDFDSTYYQTITGQRESDSNKEVILSNIVVSPDTAQCGDKIQISGKAVNIGIDDFQNQYKIVLNNKELGLNNVEKVVTEDLNQGDSSNFDMDFNVPAKAAEKTYYLDFKISYDYSDSDNTYAETSSRTFSVPLKVAGNCQAQQPAAPSVAISAELDSETPEAVAGKQVILKTTLRNTGNDQATYALSVSRNSQWSSLVSIDPQTLTLNKGESKDVSIALNLDAASQGDKQFTITATTANGSVNQNVALTITPASSSGSSITANFQKNWFIYVIILVNVILLIAIIMVIRSMMAPRRDFE